MTPFHHLKGEYQRMVLRRRDGKECCYCGRIMIFGRYGGKLTATKEHVRRKADGGTDSMANLMLACYECNNGRGERSFAEWRKERRRIYQFSRKRKRASFFEFPFSFRARFRNGDYLESFT